MDRQKKHLKGKIVCKNHTWKAVTTFKLLGIYFDVGLKNCIELNYTEKYQVLEKLFVNGTKGILPH